MIEELILRAYTDDGMRLLEKLEPLIRSEWVTAVSTVDDRDPDPELYGIEAYFDRWQSFDYRIISLDRHLAKVFGVEYFQISRIFDETGNVIQRRIGSHDFREDYPSRYHIIDTDIALGKTKDIACRIFNTERFVAPIVLKPTQDLIDMEDLFLNNSLMHGRFEIEHVNYMTNWKFFNKRTSLPTILYDPIKEIIKNAKLA